MAVCKACRADDSGQCAQCEAIAVAAYDALPEAERAELEGGDEPFVFHIRQRLARRGGNQFYRDRSERAVGTLCSAPVTMYDQPWADRTRAASWTSDPGQRFELCGDCAKRVRP